MNTTVELVRKLKLYQKLVQKRDSMRDKLATEGMDWTIKKRNKASTNLNWHCMEIEKVRVEIARLFNGSEFDVETGEKTYNPSGWHEYKH